MQTNLTQRLENARTGPKHVAIIMDGNGRWADLRGLDRSAGHYAGVSALRATIEAAAERGIGVVTVYAFSSDNWTRPPAEVSALMTILRGYLANELNRLVNNDIRLTTIGRRDRLPSDIVAAISHAEQVTRKGARLHVRIALDYSARDQIIGAAQALGPERLTREAMAIALAGGEAVPDVDLVIRTSGEQRLSDFMLWECAYAEFYFTEVLWPDFAPADLDRALAAFGTRSRRFGGRPQVCETVQIEAAE